jgi:uncharacterized protein (DUF2249 family)
MAPHHKRVAIFAAFDALEPSQSMTVIDSDDLKSLHAQLAVERPGRFDWIYEEDGPSVWRARIEPRCDCC